MTALAASARSMIPVAAQRISVKSQRCAGDPASDAVDAFAAMATTPSLNWQRQLIARRFLAAFAGLDEWQRAPLPERLAARVDVRGFAAWWAITARHRVDAAYAIASRACWGTHLAGAHPAFHDIFDAQARALGFTTGQARAQWAALATLTAIGGADPAALTRVPFDAARDAWFAAVRASRADGRVPNSATTPVHGLQATLAALGILDAPGRKSPTRPGQPVRWQALEPSAPLLVATMRGYLAQVSLSLRPGSVAIADTSLRHLATYLTEHHPDVQSAAAIGRTHVEGFKGWLANRPGYRGHPAPAPTTIGMRLGNVRAFLDRIIEWDWPDAPPRHPVLHADAPIPDHRLPRFLDDADAAALMAAARALPDLFDRVCVETLARTGMRKGEFRLLALDAIVQIGDGHWLRTPVGKLHTDRYIPLHPAVKDLLDEWLLARPEWQASDLLLTSRGRPIPPSRVDQAVQRAATNAGIGHVHPAPAQAHARHPGHQPRHEPGSHRRPPRTQVHVDDPHLRKDRRSHRRERILQRYQQDRGPLRPRGTASRRRRPQHARPPRGDQHPAPGKRPLHQTPGPRLPIRDDLPDLRLLRDHHRIPRHPHRPTRRRPPTRRHHPRTGLRHHPRQPRRYPDLTPITRISRCFSQE